MAARLGGAPLRALIICNGPADLAQAAEAALRDLGLDLIAHDGAAGMPGKSPRSERLRPADLLVLVLDANEGNLDGAVRLRLARQELPIFLCLQNGLDLQASAEPLLQAVARGDLPLVCEVRYERAVDLAWKLAQTISGFLSEQFREAQRQQAMLLQGDAASRRLRVVELATHRDLRLRQIAVRIALQQLSSQPHEAEGLVRQLVGTNKASAFKVVARVLQAMSQSNPSETGLLLTELTSTSAVFRAWVFAQLAG